ncbi:MAG TPA: zinc ribbon domain-containing protein [Thermodesulfobacteriota bacterium]|nr:zinc ribbon domain-containing protein [Thermodesulfobacteriota bacterium]
MPVFEYECKCCNSRFETLVMSTDEEVNCTDCGSEDIEKQFSSFASQSDSASFGSDPADMPTGGGCCGGGCACG